MQMPHMLLRVCATYDLWDLSKGIWERNIDQNDSSILTQGPPCRTTHNIRLKYSTRDRTKLATVPLVVILK